MTGPLHRAELQVIQRGASCDEHANPRNSEGNGISAGIHGFSIHGPPTEARALTYKDFQARSWLYYQLSLSANFFRLEPKMLLNTLK
jgi:hypothetical protein